MTFAHRFFDAGSSLRLGFRALLAAVLCLTAGQAFAQNAGCAQIKAQIAAIDRANAQNNPFAAAARRQQTEIARSVNYANSIGCNRHQFLFFGSPPPAQCPRLKARIASMQHNLAQLQARAKASVANSAVRQQLVARYNAGCQQNHPPGFFQSLFGGFNPAGPGGPPPPTTPPGPTTPTNPQAPTPGAEAVCVRLNDGSFFPLIYSATRSPELLTALCKASCPNAQVKVYTMVPGQTINTAVGLDGTPYVDLPNALKFQKSYNPADSCKPPGEDWAQALQGAEQVLGGGKGDIVVTPEKSLEMSRPKTMQASAKSGHNKSQDLVNVPTASDDSAGIAAEEVKPAASYPEGKGKIVEVTGPNGKKERVRIVGPPLAAFE